MDENDLVVVKWICITLIVAFVSASVVGIFRAKFENEKQTQTEFVK